MNEYPTNEVIVLKTLKGKFCNEPTNIKVGYELELERQTLDEAINRFERGTPYNVIYIYYRVGGIKLLLKLDCTHLDEALIKVDKYRDMVTHITQMKGGVSV